MNGGGQDYADPRVMYTNLSRYLKVSIGGITFVMIIIFTEKCEGRVYDWPCLRLRSFIDQNLHHMSLSSPVHCAQLSTRFYGCRHNLFSLDGRGHSRCFPLLYTNAELLGPSCEWKLLQLQCLVPGDGNYRTTSRCDHFVSSTSNGCKIASPHAKENYALRHFPFGRLVSG